MNVAILYGGESGEHKISCISALSVFTKIDKNKFTPYLIGITKQGLWYYQDNSTIPPLENLDHLPIVEDDKKLISIVIGKGFFVDGELLDFDFIFPVLHGTYGEDGTVQGLLELMHIPYAGSNVVGSSVGMDKIIAKRVWSSCNIPVVPFAEMNYATFKNKLLLKDELTKIKKRLSYPLFIKPVNAGSSVGVNKATNDNEIIKALEIAFQFDTRVLIEECVNPREIECAVIGNENPIAFPPGEILPNHEFYDFDAKYNDPNGASLNIQAKISTNTMNQILDWAKKAYTSILAEGFARVDFFIDKDTNKIYLNEINTLPGFTHISMFPKMCENAGIKYSDLISQIIEYGLKRDERQKARIAFLN